MTNVNQQDEFKVLEKHKNCKIEFISTTKVNKSCLLIKDQLSLSDFKQGDIRNCALIAALAAISQRPEFLSEIAPRIEHTSEGMKLQFKMFYKVEQIVVTIDDKLPFIKPGFIGRLLGIRPSLIYAKSANDNSFYLASLFEKAVVKLVCNNNYTDCEAIFENFVFSLFSDCMISSYDSFQTDSKQNLIDYLKRETDDKS